MWNVRHAIVAIACAMLTFAAVARGAGHPFRHCRQVVFGCYMEDLAQFRSFAERAKALGATHITITAEDLPINYPELSPPGDPYPAWVITNPGLLKIASPDALQPQIPQAHGRQVMRILEARCKILRKLGLKAAFHTFEPQMLPEKVFKDHPAWRGPRVDHPLRSRTRRYAPSLSHPDVRKLYTEAMGNLLKRCPEVELIQMRTNDSGCGIGWSSRLYAGLSGNPRYRTQDMPTRIRGFFGALRDAAADRNAELHINMYNVRDKHNAKIVSKLDAGMAVDHHEGPDGSPFKREVGSLLYYRRSFAPACGVPWPVTFLEQLGRASGRPPRRLVVSIGDRHNLDLYLRIYQAFCKQVPKDGASRRKLLRRVAGERVGESHADKLLEVWSALKAVEDRIPQVSAGGTVFILGCVHQRWLTRPFVPFPHRLGPPEKAHWRPFLFQARTEAHANDLMDLQASRLPDKRGGYDRVKSVLDRMHSQVDRAAGILDKLTPQLTGPAAERYRLLVRRLDVFKCLLNNVSHAVGYQRLLDALAAGAGRPDKPPIAGCRERLARIAQEEIENTRRLIALLGSESDAPLLDRAHAARKEYQRLLGRDVADQLRKKIDIMRAHRKDYDRITRKSSL